MNSFVYCWTDHKNNMIYVGSHQGAIDDGYICSSKRMKKEYTLRPLDFTREIIAVGITQDIRNLEESILKHVDAANDHSFYNLQNSYYPQISGWRHDEESIRKISASRIGYHCSPETKKKISDSNKKAVHTRVDYKHSQETKDKISSSHKGKKMSFESRENLRAKLLGRRWFNNGINRSLLQECPSGWTEGMKI